MKDQSYVLKCASVFLLILMSEFGLNAQNEIELNNDTLHLKLDLTVAGEDLKSSPISPGSMIPFLLFVSISTPHFPHSTAPKKYQDLYPESAISLAPNVPAEMQQQALIELKGYYAHCTATDKAIGDLIAKMRELGLMENTIVVFTSDHGEMMGAHGVKPTIKQLAWDESIRIPFLISYPGIGKNKGLAIKAPINTPDILPSLLGLAGIPIPNSVEGEDLSEQIKAPDPELDRTALIMQVCPFGVVVADNEYR